MFAATVWGEETKQPGFVEKLTLWMRQVFPSSMWYPNKYILISQEAVLAPSSSASVIQAARSWQILKLGKASKIIPESWSGCLFGIWGGFNKLSGKKWKPQAVVGRWWRGREAGEEGSWCAGAPVELGICSLPTPESSTAGLQCHQAWAETRFLCMTPEFQICWRHSAFFFSAEWACVFLQPTPWALRNECVNILSLTAAQGHLSGTANRHRIQRRSVCHMSKVSICTYKWQRLLILML